MAGAAHPQAQQSAGKDVPASFPKWRWARTPTILQMEAVECGAACLGIILAYHGLHVSIEELRLQCGVSRDGSKASHLLRAARHFGLEAEGYTMEIPELHEVALPFIVFWRFNHFVVVEGFSRKKVFINDPATGPRSVLKSEFDSAFTGIVLTFEKTVEFRRGGARASLIRALTQRMRGSSAALIYIALATLAVVLLNLWPPAFARVYLDSVLINRDFGWLKALLAAMLLVALLKGVATYLQQSALLAAEIWLAVRFSVRFFRHILHLPMEFFAQRFSGEIGSRVEVNDQVAALITGELATNAVNLLLIGFYAVLMYQYDRVLTFVGVGIALINLAVLRYIARRRIDDSRRLLQFRGKLVGISMAGMQLIETIKSTGAETAYFARWAGHQSRVVSAEQSLGASTLALSAIPAFLASLTAITVLVLGGLRVMEGYLTVGLLVGFQVLMASLAEPVSQMVDLGSQLQEVRGDLSRLDDVLNHPVDVQFLEAAEPFAPISISENEKLEGHLELRSITFGYGRFDPPLIRDFNLQLRPGQWVALVGGSGSGKSTIAKIAAGLYQPWSGTVLVNHYPRRSMAREKLAGSIATVEQDISMFVGTFRQNLTLWDPGVDDGTLMDAARDACIHEEIIGHFGGYDAPVEEAARNLSGGQRQRLEIARALATGARTLILDEATSALDARTEKAIMENIRRRGCSCLIIAHRLSTIRDCDEILVIDSGSVLQRGTHREMIRANGPYAKLVEAE